MTRQLINIANIVPCTQAEGPGKRFAVWVQGCPFRCAGCCNPEMLSFKGGTETPIEELIQQLLDAASMGIEGISLIGGEPFAHAEPLTELAIAARQQGLSVMVYSGYTLHELHCNENKFVAALLAETDVLVDGRFESDLPDTKRRWVGSTNQQVHFLTDRYSRDESSWTEPDTLELRWNGQDLTVNGFPAIRAADLWQRRKERKL